MGAAFSSRWTAGATENSAANSSAVSPETFSGATAVPASNRERPMADDAVRLQPPRSSGRRRRARTQDSSSENAPDAQQRSPPRSRRRLDESVLENTIGPSAPDSSMDPPIAIASDPVTATNATTANNTTTPIYTEMGTSRQPSILRQSLELILFHLIQEQHALRYGPTSQSPQCRVESFYFFGHFLARVGPGLPEEAPFLHVTAAGSSPNESNGSNSAPGEDAQNPGNHGENTELLVDAASPEEFFARHMGRPRTVARTWMQPDRVMEVVIRHLVDDSENLVQVPMMVLGVRGGAGERNVGNNDVGSSNVGTAQTSAQGQHPEERVPAPASTSASDNDAQGESEDPEQLMGTSGWAMYVVGGESTEQAIAAIEQRLRQQGSSVPISTNVAGLRGRFILSVANMNHADDVDDGDVSESVQEPPPLAAAPEATLRRHPSTRLRPRESSTESQEAVIDVNSSPSSPAFPVSPLASVAEFLSDLPSSPTSSSASVNSSASTRASPTSTPPALGSPRNGHAASHHRPASASIAPPRAFISPPTGGAGSLNTILAALLATFADSEAFHRTPRTEEDRIAAEAMQAEETGEQSSYDLFLRLAELLGPVVARHADKEAVEKQLAAFSYEQWVALQCGSCRPEVDEQQSQQCPICLMAYEKKDWMRQLPCQHVFHRDCIDTWLCGHVNNCPLCRKDAVITHKKAAGQEG